MTVWRVDVWFRKYQITYGWGGELQRYCNSVDNAESELKVIFIHAESEAEYWYETRYTGTQLMSIVTRVTLEIG